MDASVLHQVVFGKYRNGLIVEVKCQKRDTYEVSLFTRAGAMLNMERQGWDKEQPELLTGYSFSESDTKAATFIDEVKGDTVIRYENTT